MKGKTKLESQREHQKQLAQFAENVDAMGQDDEKKGIEAVREIQKVDELKQEKQKNDTLERLTDLRKFTDEEYKQGLVGWGRVALHGIKLPLGFIINLAQTKKGIVIWIRDNKKSWYARGLIPSFDPQSDMHAIEDKLMEAIDFADILAKPKGEDGFKLARK